MTRASSARRTATRPATTSRSLVRHHDRFDVPQPQRHDSMPSWTRGMAEHREHGAHHHTSRQAAQAWEAVAAGTS
jgi:hypothetical protein